MPVRDPCTGGRAGRAAVGRAAGAALALCLAGAAQAAVPVSARPLAQLLRVAEQDAPASVVALDSPALAAEIDARIAEITARVGDQVAAGELLVRLDCRLYESRLAAAEASLRELAARRRFAASQLERARDLKRKNSISDELAEQRQSELDSLVAQLEVQRQTIVQAQIDIERCRVRAPFGAVVTARLADAGSLAAPGTPLLRLVATDRLEISVRLREAEVDGLEAATEVWFRYAGARYPARLRRVLPVVDERLRTREARLSFAAASAPAGAAGRLAWRDGRLLLPAEYLVRRDGVLGLFELQAGRARFRALPGAIEGQPAAVDLPAQTRLIVDGRQRLVDGDAVVEAPSSP